ncbi:peptidylprolyl isomerase [Sphingobium amiense]|uniref:peptidylprolyl isomerase n=1 Tax=Sphingobium amiense TaxID=135719 RepID=A0A494VXF8_9SPHN|nr:peptidylprolyl isomerase [Sphingobium amiense]BBD96501.1 peptidylprolyl isomerase [Sphingobium amiense]
MIRSALFLLLALLSLTPAAAQVPAPGPATGDVRVALETDRGRIVVAVHLGKAPVTAANFLRYVDQKRFDGIAFYRGVGAPDYGFVQAGTQNDPRRILPPIAHEPTTQTGLTHDDGALSMARYAPGSATGDFFIVLGKMPAMDAHPEAAGDNQGFAVFAHVVEGMDVVKAILAEPKSPTMGDGVMKGQMLEAPVKILTARRLP